MMQDQEVVNAFLRLGRLLLAEQTTLALAQGLRGQVPEAGFREQLALAIDRLGGDTKLSLPEQVEIATYFLPLVREHAQLALSVPPILRLSARQQQPTQLIPQRFVDVEVRVQLGGGILTSLQLLRGSELLATGASERITLRDTKPLSGTRTYVAIASYANFPTQTQTVTVEFEETLRVGVGPKNPSVAYVAKLTQLPLTSPVTLSFTTVAAAALLLWVPESRQLTLLQNLDYGEANLLRTFASAPLTLPSGERGRVYWSNQLQINISAYALQATFS